MSERVVWLREGTDAPEGYEVVQVLGTGQEPVGTGTDVVNTYVVRIRPSTLPQHLSVRPGPGAALRAIAYGLVTFPELRVMQLIENALDCARADYYHVTDSELARALLAYIRDHTARPFAQEEEGP